MYISLFRSPCIQNLWVDSFTLKMVLKIPFFGATVENSTLHIHCLGLLGDSDHPVDTVVMLERWSKGYLSMTLVKPLHVHSNLPGDRVHQVNMISLLRRWSSKGCSSHREASAHLFRSPGRPSFMSVVLGMPLDIDCLGLLRGLHRFRRWCCKEHSPLMPESLWTFIKSPGRQSSLSLYDSPTEKMVL